MHVYITVLYIPVAQFLLIQCINLLTLTIFLISSIDHYCWSVKEMRSFHGSKNSFVMRTGVKTQFVGMKQPTLCTDLQICMLCNYLTIYIFSGNLRCFLTISLEVYLFSLRHHVIEVNFFFFYASPLLPSFLFYPSSYTARLFSYCRRRYGLIFVNIKAIYYFYLNFFLLNSCMQKEYMNLCVHQSYSLTHQPYYTLINTYS